MTMQARTDLEIAFSMGPTSLGHHSMTSLPPSTSRNKYEEIQNPQTDMQSKTDSQRMSKPFWATVVLSVLISTFLFALDNTILANIQPRILERFDNDVGKLPWLSTAFALGSVSMNLVWGKLYGDFNNKHLFITCVFIFEVGSAVCGAAPTLNAMIVGRAIAGIGGGGIYIGTISILTALTQISQRPLYMSLVGAVWSAGTVLGPIIGGGFAESHATWRWAFYINLCIAAICAPAFFFLLPYYRPKPNRSFGNRIRSLDLLGMFIFIGASVALIMAIAFGGSIYNWKSGQIIGLFVCSGTLWLCFCAQQSSRFLTTKEDQIFPVQFLKSYEMCILFAQSGICIACIFIPVNFMPLFFQFVKNDTALEAGVRLLPFVFVAVFGAMVNGAVMERYGFYMPWFFVGGALVTVGGALLYTVRLGSSVGTIYGYSVIAAMGAGFFVQAPFSVAQAKVDAQSVPTATAFVSCGQISGITLSLAIATSAFVNEASRKIELIIPDAPRSLIQATIAGARTAFFQDQNATHQSQILEAIVSTIDHIYIMVLIGGALAVTLSVFMKKERLFIQASALGA